MPASYSCRHFVPLHMSLKTPTQGNLLFLSSSIVVPAVECVCVVKKQYASRSLRLLLLQKESADTVLEE
jgi:hypothetical protein